MNIFRRRIPKSEHKEISNRLDAQEKILNEHRERLKKIEIELNIVRRPPLKKVTGE